MKFTAKTTNLGINLSAHMGDGPSPGPLKPAPEANQENPRKSYVYAHMDSAGKIFYVGKGKKRRAWSKDRDPLWHRYVDKHLAGKYRVVILQDNLSPSRAEQSEADWIGQCNESPGGLVNWQNYGRLTDFQALDRYHKLRDANRALIQQAKAIEKLSLTVAAKMYVEAIEAIPKYALIDYEKGLVGQLLAEEADEVGRNGEIEAIDRLTMCLLKLGRPSEAIQRSDDYFTLYKRDRYLSAYERISKRIAKVRASST
jgi:hypothetical protein